MLRKSWAERPVHTYIQAQRRALNRPWASETATVSLHTQGQFQISIARGLPRFEEKNKIQTISLA